LWIALGREEFERGGRLEGHRIQDQDSVRSIQDLGGRTFDLLGFCLLDQFTGLEWEERHAADRRRFIRKDRS
jgi:hypothetical protein